jgi:hydroxymethylpyrimidine pyrophosphatase-like HAD family hydrolase
VRYHALATDYDGTIADEGVISPATRAVLERLRASGRRIVLVTGRRLDDLARVCPNLSLFDAVVAENGAVYLRPPAKEPRLLGPPASQPLLERLREGGVRPLDHGAVIVTTTRPHEVEVLRAISALGLELQVIFNRGAVMVLPSGINKATGLEVALADLGLSPHDVVGVGDGENDHAFLTRCELAVAVGDAIPSLQAAADVVTRGGGSAGTVELVEALLRDDLASLAPRSSRHQIAISASADGESPRKGAEEELGPDESFYFRSPDGRLNLRAQSLRLFLQIADGVDDATWLHHLGQGDYSRWFRADLKDPGLADEAAAIEAAPRPPGELEAVTSARTRAGIRAAIDARYSAAV